MQWFWVIIKYSPRIYKAASAVAGVLYCVTSWQGNGGKPGEEAAGAGGDEPLSRPSLLRVPSLSAADLEVILCRKKAAYL